LHGMGKKGLRIAVLSNIPEVVNSLACLFEKLGHELTISVAADRKRSVTRPTDANTIAAPLVPKSIVAPDKESLESILKCSGPDLMLSWGFPWRIPDGALAASPGSTPRRLDDPDGR